SFSWWVIQNGGITLTTDSARRLPTVAEALSTWGLITPLAVVGLVALIQRRGITDFRLPMLFFAWMFPLLLLLAWQIINPFKDTAFLATTRLWLALVLPTGLLAGLALDWI